MEFFRTNVLSFIQEYAFGSTSAMPRSGAAGLFITAEAYSEFI